MLITYRFYDIPTVALVVGKSKRAFHVHVDLLCDASPFFKAAFTGKFKENSEKTMQLPEDDECTFELFVDWLYHQRYEMLPQPKYHHGDSVDDDDDSDDDESSDSSDSSDDDSDEGDSDDDGNDDDDKRNETDQRFLQAIRLFVLADKYRIFKLKSLVIERLFAAAKEVHMKGLTYYPLAYAYKNTTQGSGLRQFLVDYYTWYIDLSYYRSKRVKAFLLRHSDIATDFVLNLTKRLDRMEEISGPFEGDMPEEYKDKESGQEI